MSRTPLTIVEVELGEDANYSPPAGADRWSVFMRSAIMARMFSSPLGKPDNQSRRRPFAMGDSRRMGHRRRRLYPATSASKPSLQQRDRPQGDLERDRLFRHLERSRLRDRERSPRGDDGHLLLGRQGYGPNRLPRSAIRRQSTLL